MITKALVENTTEAMLLVFCFSFLYAQILSFFGERFNVLGDLGACRVKR